MTEITQSDSCFEAMTSLFSGFLCFFERIISCDPWDLSFVAFICSTRHKTHAAKPYSTVSNEYIGHLLYSKTFLRLPIDPHERSAQEISSDNSPSKGHAKARSSQQIESLLLLLLPLGLLLPPAAVDDAVEVAEVAEGDQAEQAGEEELLGGAERVRLWTGAWRGRRGWG